MNPIQELFSLKDKVAVVLGGTSGIGQTIARAYARAGATTIASSRSQERVNAEADQLEALGSKTLRITTDVQDRASLENICNQTVKEFGRVDILVVTSGALKKSPAAEMTEEDFTYVIDVNLNGTFRANQVFGRQMIQQQSGCIINTASLTSFVSFSGVAPYAASKAGVVSLTETLASEWAQYNVRVNAIAPGVFRTPLNSAALDIPERAAAIKAHTPMGRFGNLKELVGAAVFLASEAANFVTGETIAVDGGFLARGI